MSLWTITNKYCCYTYDTRLVAPWNRFMRFTILNIDYTKQNGNNTHTYDDDGYVTRKHTSRMRASTGAWRMRNEICEWQNKILLLKTSEKKSKPKISFGECTSLVYLYLQMCRRQQEVTVASYVVRWSAVDAITFHYMCCKRAKTTKHDTFSFDPFHLHVYARTYGCFALPLHIRISSRALFSFFSFRREFLHFFSCVSTVFFCSRHFALGEYTGTRSTVNEKKGGRWREAQ